MNLYLVFDVESVGLHGEGFAVGGVLVDQEGKELDHLYAAAPVDSASGAVEDRIWVKENVPEVPQTHAWPRLVRADFWRWWRECYDHAQPDKVYLCADVAWPVEARFLARCVDDHPEARAWEGPYPLIDVASVRLAAGFDALATEERHTGELPVHDPLADARQSARLLIEALNKIKALEDYGSWPVPEIGASPMNAPR